MQGFSTHPFLLILKGIRKRVNKVLLSKQTSPITDNIRYYGNVGSRFNLNAVVPFSGVDSVVVVDRNVMGPDCVVLFVCVRTEEFVLAVKMRKILYNNLRERRIKEYMLTM